MTVTLPTISIYQTTYTDERFTYTTNAYTTRIITTITILQPRTTYTETEFEPYRTFAPDPYQWQDSYPTQGPDPYPYQGPIRIHIKDPIHIHIKGQIHTHIKDLGRRSALFRSISMAGSIPNSRNRSISISRTLGNKPTLFRSTNHHNSH